MDNYENMFNTICRLCLSQNSDGKMVSLIDNSTEDGLSSFGKSISVMTNVSLQKDDKLPTMMCQKCVYLLKQSIYFKLKCESTDKQLKQLVTKNLNNESSDRNYKELVCEYVMFKQYFPSTLGSEPKKPNGKPKRTVKIKKIVHRRPPEKVSSDNDFAENLYDFDDFVDNGDKDQQQDEYSNDINNILNTIETFKTSDTNVPTSQRTNHNIVRREQRYKSVPMKRNLTCKLCNKILANQVTYDHHMQRHNNCKLICDQCGKGFPVLAELNIHQIARHGVGPYLECDHCSYKAPRKIELIEHLRLHTGERPFTCDKCGLTFRRRAIWRNHLILHKDKLYQCQYCPKKFYRPASVIAHVNNIHDRLFMYMCSICSVTYAKTHTVRRHMADKHGIPREKQGKVMKVVNGSVKLHGKSFNDT